VWEQDGNDNWGESPFWNNFFLQRLFRALSIATLVSNLGTRMSGPPG
jgi:hypothetical protein